MTRFRPLSLFIVLGTLLATGPAEAARPGWLRAPKPLATWLQGRKDAAEFNQLLKKDPRLQRVFAGALHGELRRQGLERSASTGAPFVVTGIGGLMILGGILSGDANIAALTGAPGGFLALLGGGDLASDLAGRREATRIATQRTLRYAARFRPTLLSARQQQLLEIK
jgi:hypothetical protein